MGGALLAGWLAGGVAPADVWVIEPAAEARGRLAATGVHSLAEAAALPADLRPEVVLFAIKPQMMATALPTYQAVVGRSDALVLSIAAGTLAARFEAAFGAGTPVVRAMPNTPAAIGQGVSALFANPAVSDRQRALAERLLAAVGSVHWVADEAQLHVITAMSGGGPAYVFLLIEALANAAIKAGLPAALAWPMARGTVVGSGALAAASAEPPAVLRQNVTSPGGTTQAALAVLMAEDGIQPLFDRAIAAGTARSRELA